MVEGFPENSNKLTTDDLAQLDDYALTDIATDPKTPPETQSFAEAEITKREQTGAYNLDRAEQERDRQKVLAEKLAEEERFKRRLGASSVEAAIRAFRDNPTREKILHPDRPTTKEWEYEAHKKDIDIERNLRRNIKEFNKYDDSFSNPRKMAAAERRANLPIFESSEPSSEQIDIPESPETKAEKTYRFYEENFSRYTPKWISSGVVNSLAEGRTDLPTDALLRSGFWSCEEDRIHRRIDPEDTFTVESIDAEGDLKKRVTKDLIDERDEEIPEAELKEAKREGLLQAISVGATAGKNNKVTYAIPTDQSEKLSKLIQDTELDLDSEKTRFKSYSGFVNIVDAIKDNQPATLKGFEALDWYFDTFKYGENMDDFLGVMGTYQEVADKSFNEKMDEYLKHREELELWQEQQTSIQERTLSALSKAELVNREQFFALLDNKMTRLEDGEIFPLHDINNGYGKTHLERVLEQHPSSAEKAAKALSEVEKIEKLDPKPYYALCDDIFETTKKQEEKEYAMIIFRSNNFDNAIAIHIGDKSRAMFCVQREASDDNKEDWWRDYFRGISIRNRSEEVRKFTCQGYSKQGFMALDRQWERIWTYLGTANKGGHGPTGSGGNKERMADLGENSKAAAYDISKANKGIK